MLYDFGDCRLVATPPPIDGVADGYRHRRNEAAMPMYELTCQRATLEPPSPRTVRLRAALRGNQEQANRFAGVIWGTVPVAGFFAPENIERIMKAA